MGSGFDHSRRVRFLGLDLLLSRLEREKQIASAVDGYVAEPGKETPGGKMVS